MSAGTLLGAAAGRAARQRTVARSVWAAWSVIVTGAERDSALRALAVSEDYRQPAAGGLFTTLCATAASPREVAAALRRAGRRASGGAASHA